MVERFGRGRDDKLAEVGPINWRPGWSRFLPEVEWTRVATGHCCPGTKPILLYYPFFIICILSSQTWVNMISWLWHAHLYSWWLQHLSNKLCCWSWSFYAKCNIQIFSGWSKLCKSLLRVHSWRKSWKIITSFISYRLDNIRRDYIDPDQNKIVRIRIQQKSVNPIGSGALDVRFCSNLFT